MLNLSILLEDSARNVPDQLAVICGEQRFTYTEINRLANKIANGLRQIGIEPGDKVALSCPNLPFFPIVYYGILKAGATVVPLNILLKAREIAYHLMDSDAKAYFCFEGSAELAMGADGFAGFSEADDCSDFVLLNLDPAAASPFEKSLTFWEFIKDQPESFETTPAKPDDTAVILYTSGTTGQPKGAELTHLNMIQNARLADNMYPQNPHDVHLITLPLFHSFGQTVQMNAGFYTRSTLVLLPRFTPDLALELMQTHEVTIFAGVPTMYWALLNQGNSERFDLELIANRIRLCLAGGSPLPMEVIKAFETKFDVKIIEGYGLSETSPIATFNKPADSRPGSVGVPVWGVEVRVVDEMQKDVPRGELGEIIIRGHNIMKGYYKRPEATAAAIRGGWFHSGDIGRFDEDGYLHIADRVKDMIIRGGFNVYPRELEEVLHAHEAVSLCAVVGVPSDEHGEEVKAYIVKKPGSATTESELIAWCRRNMASYKYPRIVEFRESLPMTATGKILKRELR
jgi:long-chain acyl-CoA synthetase